MTAEQHKALVASIFDELARGNVRAMRDAMNDDFRWTFPGNWSWAGTWAPKRAVLEELLRPLMAQLVDYRSSADLILADGDRVVVQATARATTRRGDPYHQTYCYLFRIADGGLAEVVEHCDTALVERYLTAPLIRPAT